MCCVSQLQQTGMQTEALKLLSCLAARLCMSGSDPRHCVSVAGRHCGGQSSLASKPHSWRHTCHATQRSARMRGMRWTHIVIWLHPLHASALLIRSRCLPPWFWEVCTAIGASSVLVSPRSLPAVSECQQAGQRSAHRRPWRGQTREVLLVPAIHSLHTSACCRVLLASCW